jgi:hypothetical protein
MLSSETAGTTTAPGETGKPAEGQPTETKAEETKDSKEGKTEGETKPEGAPEKYEFTAPEGVTYDASVLDAFSKSAKEANLTQDVAQKMLSELAPAIKARSDEQVKAIQDGWTEATKTDKEIGGDKLQATLVLAKKGVSEFATPALRELLDTTALGNHPEVIRLFSRIGQSISEDKFVKGDPSANVVPVVDMYPNTPKQGA